MNEINLSQTIKFHDSLNPVIFKNNRMKPNIRKSLLKIAKHFIKFIEVPIKVADITISGSNAAYTYNKNSDIDLHIIVDVPKTVEYTALLTAKKNDYNSKFDITIKNIDVELYAQPLHEKHYSQGIYSVLNDEWVSIPEKHKPDISDNDVKEKYKNYRDRIKLAVRSNNYKIVKHTADTIKKIRASGLEEYGEFSVENLVFKMLRAQGWIDKLYHHLTLLTNKELSVEEISHEIK